MTNPTPVSRAQSLTFSDVGVTRQPSPDTTVWLVTDTVNLRLSDGLSDLEGTARHLRLSVRTLQRRLADEGTNYRTILATERYRRACALLQETEHSITDIALTLGYDYTEDFTRAFAKIHGCPPSLARNPAVL